MKKIVVTNLMLLLAVPLYSDSNVTKVEEVKKIELASQKAKEMKKMLEYDTVATEMSIDQDIEAVEIYKEETLDKLGSNKECYIVFSRIKQYEKKIKQYLKYKTKTALYEIEKAEKNIEKAKKSCPNYLDFKGDK